MRVRILDVPPGEAPDEIRQAWVGLRLPVADQHPNPVTVPCHGVLTGPRTWLGHVWRVMTGRAPARAACYLVPVDDALAELATSDPAAATWWRENTPDLIGAGRVFGFPVDLCQPDTERPAPPEPADMEASPAP